MYVSNIKDNGISEIQIHPEHKMVYMLHIHD